MACSRKSEWPRPANGPLVPNAEMSQTIAPVTACSIACRTISGCISLDVSTTSDDSIAVRMSSISAADIGSQAMLRLPAAATARCCHLLSRALPAPRVSSNMTVAPRSASSDPHAPTACRSPSSIATIPLRNVSAMSMYSVPACAAQALGGRPRNASNPVSSRPWISVRISLVPSGIGSMRMSR